MRFDVSDELRLFAESVRAAIREWEPPREPELGAWLDALPHEANSGDVVRVDRAQQ